MAGVLFEDIFNVKDIDPEGKKFDRALLEKQLRVNVSMWTQISSAIKPNGYACKICEELFLESHKCLKLLESFMEHVLEAFTSSACVD